MIGVVLTFLSKHWRLVLVGLLIAAVGLQSARLSSAHKHLTEARAALINPATHKTWQSEAVRDAAALSTCHANVAALDTAIAGQNASIAALKKEADARSARANAAVKAAQRDTKDARRDAAEIMARKPSGDLCASALSLLREP